MPGPYGSGPYGSGLYGVGAGTTLTVNIAGIAPFVLDDGNFSLADVIEQVSQVTFTVIDVQGVYNFVKGQQVTITDTLEGQIFYGSILTDKKTVEVGTTVWHSLTCNGRVSTLDAQTSDTLYTEQYSGAIAVDQVSNLWPQGILANYALDTDTSQADFSEGNLSGVVAAINVEDGDLELAPAGTSTTVIENTTSVFNSGTLNNVSASNNTLIPTATNAIKIQGTESITNDANAYTYVEIWSGSVTILTGRYLAYDIWINSSSPNGTIGVDFVCTDNTSLRDHSIYNDAHNIPPHPKNDISGYAFDQWYHRTFLLDNLAGKTIKYVTVVLQGNIKGTYTGYIKNIYEVDASNNIINTFYGGSFNLNPPKQLQSNGYTAISVTSVPTYDCSNANRVSPSYDLSNVNILKNSFLDYKVTLPANYAFTLEYSLDGGNSYIFCTNNSALPALLAGLSVSGVSIQFRQSFQQLVGAIPEATPTLLNGVLVPVIPALTSMIVTLNPSYTASKSDVYINATTNAQWNAGSLTNSIAQNNILSPYGAVRNWHVANLTNQTVYGDGATGPGPTTVRQLINYDDFWMVTGISMEGRSYFDFVGTWADGIIEGDIYVDVGTAKYGFFYRTTGRSNYDANCAYYLEITPTSVTLQRGSNSSAGSTGVRTQVATASITVTGTVYHHIKCLFQGSTHTVWFDDVQLFSATDSTYTAAGTVGFRVSNSNASAGYQGQLKNFGISDPGLSGSWLSPSTSLAAAGTYGGSVVTWEDVSIGNQSTSILVQSSVDGGSTFQTLTNGGPVPNLTLGQSLSGVSLQLQVTLTTATACSLPQIQFLVAKVLGGFSSSGTRINKALLLTPVGTCGSTLVSWNALTPTNTSVALATSLDGIIYTSVANGGAISGLTTQPAPTIDSFNLISSGSYTSTARTGGTAAPWIWDTTNSRLTVSGGTNALLIYGAISCKDVDVIFDLDEADNCGIVWRWTDAGDYYELLIYDASSNAGSTNVLKLFKVVANVKTPIAASTPIALTRGQYVKRARITMIGTTITIYFDGVSVLTATDSSLAGPGQVGFSNVSGVGRLYNLRIQPQGRSLSGAFVYVKETLTSTDPTQTPQIINQTTLVTNPNIGVGTLVPTADYRNTYKSDNIKSLAKLSNYYWNVPSSGAFIFIPRETVPSPWVVTTKDILPDNLEVDTSADLYRNRHTMKGVQSTIVTSEIKTGDGSSTSFTLKYPVSSMTSITLDGQVQTLGLKGTKGYNFYYAVGDNSIAQDSSGTILQNIDQLIIDYTGQATTTVTRDNTGQFPGTVSQRQYIDQSGLSIPVQTILNQASAVVSTNGNSNDLDVSLVHRIAIDVNITAQSGTSPTVQFFLDRKDAAGNYDPIYQSSVLSALGPLSITIGPKCSVTEVLGQVVRIRWAIGGSGSPSKTFSISIQGRVDPGLAGIGVVEAVEDVGSLNLNVAGAQARGDAALQQWGVQGATIQFTTKRTGLAVGQYLSVFHQLLGLNDAAMLATSVTRRAKFANASGSPSTSYFFDVVASNGPVLTSWSNTLNSSLA